MPRTKVEPTAGKLAITPHSRQEMHRAGWRYAIDALKPITSDHGILCDGFIEESHSWNLSRNLAAGIVPYCREWVGFLHNPPGMPKWYHHPDSPQQLLNHPVMTQSLRHCVGLFTLSNYLAEWLRKRVDIPVCTLTSPTDTAVVRFDFDQYRANQDKHLIQIGYWLRRLYSIQTVPTTRFTKLWLVPKPEALVFRDQVERLHVPDAPRIGRYAERPWVDHGVYDQLLKENIVFIDYYDVSASNAITECIVRRTPLLVNKLPAVIEYLGMDYPLYYENTIDAARLAEDYARVHDAHLYLCAIEVDRFTAEYFRRSVEGSDIYRKL